MNNIQIKDSAPVEGTREVPPDVTINLPTSSSNKQMTVLKKALLLVTALGAAMAANRMRSYRKNSIKKSRVFITGGSRGLGFALAEQYLLQGASVILCARNSSELEQASHKLSEIGSEVHVYPCDITNSEEVKQLVRKIKSQFGGIDTLVNNAGVIEAGPFDAFSFESIQKVVDTNLMGMIRITLDFIPLMSSRARIINITSIGGTVAVPHLLPYTISKFGALGFSLGLDSELSQKGISVTTVLPGLMRTGSFVHANFRGAALKEFDWFTLGATLPLISISARRAAKQIVLSGQRRKRFVVLGPQAKLLRLVYQMFPELMLGLMRAVIRLYPSMPKRGGQRSVKGFELRQNLPRGGITRLGDEAGDELNENVA